MSEPNERKNKGILTPAGILATTGLAFAGFTAVQSYQELLEVTVVTAQCGDACQGPSTCPLGCRDCSALVCATVC